MKKKYLVIIFIIFVVIALVLFLITKYSKPVLLSFNPTDGQTNVSLTANINLNFNRQLTSDEENKVSVKINPRTDLDSNWIKNRLALAPKSGFIEATKYSVEVDYDGVKMKSFSFSTALFNQSTLSTPLPNDFLFSQTLAQFISSNPWYPKLPIENSQYRIVYDFNQKSFRIRILVPVTSDQQKQQIINQALTDLKNIGVTQNPIPYYVLTQ